MNNENEGVWEKVAAVLPLVNRHISERLRGMPYVTTNDIVQPYHVSHPTRFSISLTCPKTPHPGPPPRLLSFFGRLLPQTVGYAAAPQSPPGGLPLPPAQ